MPALLAIGIKHRRRNGKEVFSYVKAKKQVNPLPFYRKDISLFPTGNIAFKTWRETGRQQKNGYWPQSGK